MGSLFTMLSTATLVMEPPVHTHLHVYSSLFLLLSQGVKYKMLVHSCLDLKVKISLDIPKNYSFATIFKLCNLSVTYDP